MEIRIVVPDAFAASDLTWHLNATTRVSRVDGIDGSYVVYVEAGKETDRVLEEIRTWATTNGLPPLTVHLGDEPEVVAAG